MTINVSRVLSSPRLCKSWIVLRNTGHFAIGGYTQDKEKQIPMTGVAVPTDSKDIDQLPEGDRVSESWTFFSKDPIYVTHNDPTKGTSDRVSWKGSRYKVVRVRNFIDFGYNKAIAVRLSGD